MGCGGMVWEVDITTRLCWLECRSVIVTTIVEELLKRKVKVYHTLVLTYLHRKFSSFPLERTMWLYSRYINIKYYYSKKQADYLYIINIEKKPRNLFCCVVIFKQAFYFSLSIITNPIGYTYFTKYIDYNRIIWRL